MIMGKMSTMRKITRLIKEIKEFCGPQLYANRNAALIEYLPLMFQMVYQQLKLNTKEGALEACLILKDLGITLDAFKEHILCLQMCGEEADFADLPTQIKKTFTVTYNNTMKSSVKPVKKSRKVDENP